jgi:hypothetical protein
MLFPPGGLDTATPFAYIGAEEFVEQHRSSTEDEYALEVASVPVASVLSCEYTPAGLFGLKTSAHVIPYKFVLLVGV